MQRSEVESPSLESSGDAGARYQAAFDHAGVGIAEVAIDGRWLRANARLCEIVGYPYEELTRLTFQDITHPDDVAPDLALLGEVLDGRRSSFAMEKRYIRKDGSVVWALLTVSLVRTSSGRPDYFISVVVDVTEEKRAKEALEEARRQADEARQHAEAASRVKDDFLAMLGHELRNPLSPIMTALHLVKLRGGDGIRRELGVIERQAQHLVRLVDDLLDVSRIASGKVTLNRDQVELAEVIAAAIELASPVIETGRHRLVTDVPKDGLVVDVDRTRMAQVVGNLLTNAAKYTPAGGRIAVSARRERDEVVIEVEDTGSGISPELLPRVFDLFVQARQTLERSRGGLGLGLTIVKNLVSMHGGTVSADSVGAGEGSTFTVRLPAQHAESSKYAIRGDGPRLATRERRVLVVDDNEDAADMLAETLGARGYSTAIAHDGPEALRIAREFHPDTALLDIGLPVMDGYELAELLREQQGGGDLLLVAITGYGRDADQRRAREAGFQRHLTKPVDLDVLASLLEQG